MPRKCRLRVGGHSSHVAPWSCTERERPPASQYPSLVRETTKVSAARRARAQQARVFCHLPRDTERSGARASVMRKPAACWRPQLARPRSRTEGERPPAGAVPIRDAQTDHNQRGTARMGGKLTSFPISRDTASAVALARRSHESRLCAGGLSSHVAPRSCTEGQWPPAGAVPFHVA